MSTLKDLDLNSRERNFKIDKRVFAERMRQDYMFDVLEELQLLHD